MSWDSPLLTWIVELLPELSSFFTLCVILPKFLVNAKRDKATYEYVEVPHNQKEVKL
jgi:hypothetical protein